MSFPWPRAASVPMLTWDDDGNDVQDGEVWVCGPGQNAHYVRRLFSFFEAKLVDHEWLLTFVDWQAEPKPLFYCRRIGIGVYDLHPGDPMWIYR